MKAIRLDSFGPAEALRLAEVPDPVAGPREVVVRLAFAAVNHLDIDVRNGASGMDVRLPHVPGTEGVGTVEVVGAGVTGWKPGDRVGTYAFRTCGACAGCRAGHENLCRAVTTLGGQLPGAYAERIAVRDDQLVAVPSDLAFREAMAVYKAATAREALVDTARLEAGETVLVTGAGGGVGSAAVVLAKHLGARVIAATGADYKCDRLRALGADDAVNYTREPIAEAMLRFTAGEGVDVALDVAAGTVLNQAIRGLRPGGRVAVVGAHAGETVPLDALDLFRRHVAVLGCGRYTRRILGDVFTLAAAGRIAPPVHAVYPLAAAAEAHRVMESRKFLGRLLLEIGCRYLRDSRNRDARTARRGGRKPAG